MEWVIVQVVLAIISALHGYKQAKKAEERAKRGRAGFQANRYGQSEALPMIYGRSVKISPVISYLNIIDLGLGDKVPNEAMHLVLNWGIGEISGFSDFRIDDKPFTDAGLSPIQIYDSPICRNKAGVYLGTGFAVNDTAMATQYFTHWQGSNEGLPNNTFNYVIYKLVRVINDDDDYGYRYDLVSDITETRTVNVGHKPGWWVAPARLVDDNWGQFIDNWGDTNGVYDASKPQMLYKGVPTTFVKLVMDEEFKRYPQGLPQFSAVIDGRKVRIYLHEDFYSFESTDNPAWIINDYLTATDGGFGFDQADIDLQSFLDASEYFNEEIEIYSQFNEASPYVTKVSSGPFGQLPTVTMSCTSIDHLPKVGDKLHFDGVAGEFKIVLPVRVSEYNGSYFCVAPVDTYPGDLAAGTNVTATAFETRSTCSAILDTTVRLRDNLETLLEGSRCDLMEDASGRIRLIVDRPRQSVLTITEEMLAGGISSSMPPSSERYNKVTVRYIDIYSNHQENEAIYPVPGSQLATDLLEEDNGIEMTLDITVDTISNYHGRYNSQL